MAISENEPRRRTTHVRAGSASEQDQATAYDRQVRSAEQAAARDARRRAAADTSGIDFDPDFGAGEGLDLDAIQRGTATSDSVRYTTRQAARQAASRRAGQAASQGRAASRPAASTQPTAQAQPAASQGRSRSRGARARQAAAQAPGTVTHTVDRHGNRVRIEVDENGVEHRFVRKKSSSRKHKRRKLARRIILGCVAVVLVAAVAVTGLFAASATSALGKVTGLTSEAKTLVTAVQKGDAASFDTAAASLTTDVNELYDATSGIPWKIFSHLPFIGQDVMAARQIVHLAYDAVNDVLPDVKAAVDATDGQPLFSSDLSYNVQVTKAACDSLAYHSDTIAFHAKQLEGDRTFAISQVSELYGPLQQAVSYVNDIAQLGDGEGFHYLAGMLGCYDDRFYLVVAQTNSECRATAGFMGSFIPVTVSGGKIDVGESYHLGTADGEGGTFNTSPWDDVWSEFTSEEWALFNTELGSASSPYQKIGDLNFIPDFSRVGRLYADSWRDQNMGGELNGIISLDPIMLQNLMELVVKSVTLEDGTTLAVSDLSEEILHTTYVENEKNSDQDDHFSDIMKSCIPVFAEKLSSLDYEKLAKTLAEGCEDSHLMAWMDARGEQKLVHQLGASHSFETDETGASVGVYLNNITWGKSDWFLSCDTQVDGFTKNADGTTSYRLTTTLRNHYASEEEAASYNLTVQGVDPDTNPYTYRRCHSDIVTGIWLMSPCDGTISDVSMEGNTFETIDGTYQGCDVVYGLTQIAAQEHVTVSYTVTVTAEYADQTLKIRQTPLCGNWS